MNKNKKEQKELMTKAMTEITESAKAQGDFESVLSDFQNRNPFIYGAWCEMNMEQNLREDYKRKTTFTSDLSLAEMFGIKSVCDTIKNVLKSWTSNVEYIMEFIICLNLKSWEMHARKKPTWSRFYADAYYAVKDYVLTYYEGDENAIKYYMDYVD